MQESSHNLQVTGKTHEDQEKIYGRWDGVFSLHLKEVPKEETLAIFK